MIARWGLRIVDWILGGKKGGKENDIFGNGRRGDERF